MRSNELSAVGGGFASLSTVGGAAIEIALFGAAHMSIEVCALLRLDVFASPLSNIQVMAAPFVAEFGFGVKSGADEQLASRASPISNDAVEKYLMQKAALA